MLRKETLEKLTEGELEKIYQDKKVEYDKRKVKNKRIQSILERKRNTLKTQVHSIQNEVNLLHTKHPELIVAEEGGVNENPDQLKATIQQLHTTILNQQTKQIKLKKQLKEINLGLMKKNTEEKRLQKENEELEEENDKLANQEQDSSEKMQLAVITSEYQSAQDILETLIVEIEHEHRKLHRQG